MSEDEFRLAPMVTDWDTALAVVAHPDDVEFGAGGAVAVWTAAGRKISYLMLSHGEAGIDALPPEKAAPVREAEQRQSAAMVGVTAVEFLDHQDGVMEYGVPLRRDIALAIRRHRPDLVITFNHRECFPGGKPNSPDHRNVGQAVIDAAGDAGNRWIFPEDGLEPWGGVRYIAVASSPAPTHAVDITDTLDLAVAALSAHQTYLGALGLQDIRGPFTKVARDVGKDFGDRPAIAFELICR